MCPHCIGLVVLGFLAGMPIIGILFWKLRVWLKKRLIKSE